MIDDLVLERWNARKQAQQEAYAKMQVTMVELIPRYIAHRIEIVRQICKLYSDYCDRWETY